MKKVIKVFVILILFFVGHIVFIVQISKMRPLI